MRDKRLLDADEGVNLFNRVTGNFAEGKNAINSCFYVVEPDDIAAVSGNEQLKRMNALADAMIGMSPDLSCYFYAYSVTFDFTSEVSKQKALAAGAKGYAAKLSEINRKTYEELSMATGDVRRRVYMLALSGPLPKQTIEVFFEKINRNLMEARMVARRAEREEVVSLFNRLLLEDTGNKEPVVKNRAYRFRPTRIETEGTNGHSFAQVVTVLQMPRYPIGPFWLSDLFDVNDVVTCMQVETLEEKRQNSFIESLSTDFTTLRKSRSKIKNQQNENNYEAIEAIIADISRGIQQAKLVKISVLINEKSVSAMRVKFRQVRRILERIGCAYNNVNFRQLQALRTLQPFWDQEIERDVEVALQTDALGLAYPFTQTSYLDKGGGFIGMSAGQTPIVFNQCDRKRAQNGNMVVLGTSGSRKSTLMKVSILAGMTNEQVERSIVVDWENEYVALAENFEQTVLRFTRSSDRNAPALNIFEIPRDPSRGVAGIEPVSLRERYVNQVQYLVGLLPIIFTRSGERLGSDEIAVLELAIKLTYEKNGFDDQSPIEKKSNEDWPTLDELYKVMKAMSKSTEYGAPERRDCERLARLCEQYVKGGIYDGIFNRHTNVSLSDATKLVVFNLHGLFAVDAPGELKTAMLMSVLRFFNREMVDHRRKYPREGDPTAKFINFFIDEFHILVNEDYPQGLQMLAGMYAQVRKYYCQITIATQSLVTFTRSANETVKRHTQVILDNSNYKMILSMTEQALSDVNEKLFAGSSNSLTSAETDYLSRGSNVDPGRFLLMAGANQRVSGRVWSGKNLSDSEMHRPLNEITELVQLWQPKAK